jgi:hypothetical protein
MVLVLAPTCTLAACVTLSLIGYFYKKQVAIILVKICPAKIMEKLAIKDNMDAVEEAPKVTTEEPSDSDEEAGHGHNDHGKAKLEGDPAAKAHADKKKKKKKKKIDKKQAAADYRGDWMLTVVVERAQNLPCLDASLRDPRLIGNSGTPPHRAGHRNAHTPPQRGLIHLREPCLPGRHPR